MAAAPRTSLHVQRREPCGEVEGERLLCICRTPHEALALHALTRSTRGNSASGVQTSTDRRLGSIAQYSSTPCCWYSARLVKRSALRGRGLMISATSCSGVADDHTGARCIAVHTSRGTTNTSGCTAVSRAPQRDVRWRTECLADPLPTEIQLEFDEQLVRHPLVPHARPWTLRGPDHRLAVPRRLSKRCAIPPDVSAVEPRPVDQ